MIKKVGGGYKVLSEKGKNLGGPYKSKQAAQKRLKQVEYFKHGKGFSGRLPKDSAPMPLDPFGSSIAKILRVKPAPQHRVREGRVGHLDQFRIEPLPVCLVRCLDRSFRAAGG
jgi:hypothetical protein